MNDSDTSCRFIWDVHLLTDDWGNDSNEWAKLSPSDDSFAKSLTPLKMLSIEREYFESENLEYKPCDWSPFQFTFNSTPAEEWEMGAYVYDAVFDATTPTAPKISPMMRRMSLSVASLSGWKKKNFSQQRRVNSVPSKKNCNMTAVNYTVKVPASEPSNIKWRNGLPLVHPVSSDEYVQPRQLLFSTNKKSRDDSLQDDFLRSIDDAIKVFEELNNTTLNVHNPIETLCEYNVETATIDVCSVLHTKHHYDDTSYQPFDFGKCTDRKMYAKTQLDKNTSEGPDNKSSYHSKRSTLWDKENSPYDVVQNATSMSPFSPATADPLRELKNVAGTSSITFKFGDNKPKKIKRTALKKRTYSDPLHKRSHQQKMPTKMKVSFNLRRNSDFCAAAIHNRPMCGYYMYPNKTFGIYVPYAKPMPSQQSMARSLKSPRSSNVPNKIASTLP